MREATYIYTAIVVETGLFMDKHHSALDITRKLSLQGNR